VVPPGQTFASLPTEYLDESALATNGDMNPLAFRLIVDLAGLDISLT